MRFDSCARCDKQKPSAQRKEKPDSSGIFLFENRRVIEFPNISDDDADKFSRPVIIFYRFRTFIVPSPVVWTVKIGWSNETLTCDCAARL